MKIDEVIRIPTIVWKAFSSSLPSFAAFMKLNEKIWTLMKMNEHGGKKGQAPKILFSQPCVLVLLHCCCWFNLWLCSWQTFSFKLVLIQCRSAKLPWHHYIKLLIFCLFILLYFCPFVWTLHLSNVWRVSSVKSHSLCPNF